MYIDCVSRILHNTKETLNHEVYNEETTVDVLLNVCNNNFDQCKRILEALGKDDEKMHACTLVMAYAQTFIPKHSYRASSLGLFALPQEVVEESNNSSSHQNFPI